MAQSTEPGPDISPEARAQLIAAIAAKHMRRAVQRGAIALPGPATGVIPLYRETPAAASSSPATP